MNNEFISDLQRDGLVIIQKENGFCFGTDAVLLADFATDIRSSRTCDLCTGTGIVPILLYARTNAQKIYGVEIQSDIADMASRSVKLNGIQDRVEILCEDLKDTSLPQNSFDVITCNPPYMKCGDALLNENDTVTISRHEVKCTLDDVIKTAARLLKTKGHLVMVHKPSRLADVICSMRKYNIEPKRLRMVHSFADKPPSMFLIDGALAGGQELKVLPPLFLYEQAGKETEELINIYNRQGRKDL